MPFYNFHPNLFYIFYYHLIIAQNKNPQDIINYYADLGYDISVLDLNDNKKYKKDQLLNLIYNQSKFGVNLLLTPKGE